MPMLKTPWIQDKLNSYGHHYSVYKVPAIKEWSDYATSMDQQLIAYSPVLLDKAIGAINSYGDKKEHEKAIKELLEVINIIQFRKI